MFLSSFAPAILHFLARPTAPSTRSLLVPLCSNNVSNLKIFCSHFGSKVSSQEIKVKGRNLHYVVAGSGPKVLVCIPGTFGTAMGDYIFQLKGLNPEKLTTIAWDPLGQGLCRPPDRDFSGNHFHRDAEHLAEMMEKLGHKKYSILGWSQGGVTAIHLAARYPENMEKLILLGTLGRLDEAFVNCTERFLVVDNWPEEMLSPVKKFYGEQYVRNQWEEWKKCLYRLIEEQDGYTSRPELLESVQCPTLIIQGTADPITPSSHAKYLHKYIPNSRLYMWPEGKHNIHLRNPNEFNQLVEQYLVQE